MKYLTSSFATALLIATAQLSNMAFAQDNVPVKLRPDLAQASVQSKAAATTDPLADGAEIFENLTEAAPVIKPAAFNDSMTKFKALYPDISARLSPDGNQRLDTLVAGVRTAWQKQDRGHMAIESIEIYRLLQESIDHSRQPVPAEVSMLDYSGFKLQALLLSKNPDWTQIRKTVQEATNWWGAIKTKVNDKALQDAMTHTIAGYKKANDRKDPRLLSFAAEMDLILVDGLETFF